MRKNRSYLAAVFLCAMLNCCFIGHKYLECTCLGDYWILFSTFINLIY